MDKQYEICKVIQDRIDDALDNVRAIPVAHPDEGRRIAKAQALKALKKDLKRSGLWVII